MSYRGGKLGAVGGGKEWALERSASSTSSSSSSSNPNEKSRRKSSKLSATNRRRQKRRESRDRERREQVGAGRGREESDQSDSTPVTCNKRPKLEHVPCEGKTGSNSNGATAERASAAEKEGDGKYALGEGQISAGPPRMTGGAREPAVVKQQGGATKGADAPQIGTLIYSGKKAGKPSKSSPTGKKRRRREEGKGSPKEESASVSRASPASVNPMSAKKSAEKKKLERKFDACVSKTVATAGMSEGGDVATAKQNEASAAANPNPSSVDSGGANSNSEDASAEPVRSKATESEAREPSASSGKREIFDETSHEQDPGQFTSSSATAAEPGVEKENETGLANIVCKEEAGVGAKKTQITLTQGNFLAVKEENEVTKVKVEANKPKKGGQITLTQGDFLAVPEKTVVKGENPLNPDGSMDSAELRVRGKMTRYTKGEVWVSSDPKYSGFAFGLGKIVTANMEHEADVAQLFLKLDKTYIGPKEAARVTKQSPHCEWVIVEAHELTPKSGRVQLKSLREKLEAERAPNTTLYYKEEAPTYAYYTKGSSPFNLPAGEKRPIALDLFAGGGGMSLGLKKAGFNVKYKVDANEACCSTLRRNFPKKKVYQKLLSTFLKDLKEGRLKKVDTERIVLVHGSPPCQAWCLANTSGGDNDEQNKQATLDFLDTVQHIQPPFVSMENVPGLASKRRLNDAEMSNLEYLQMVMGKLISMGYSVNVTQTYASHFGDPQKRKRLVLFAAKQGYQLPSNPKQTHGVEDDLQPVVTVGDAMGDLEDVAPNGPGRVQLENGKIVQGHFIEGTKLAGRSDDDIRLSRNKPVAPASGTANTLRKQNKMQHSECNRYLTLLECKRLMSFPDSHVLEGTKKEMRDQVGNAVPVRFAEALGRTIMESIVTSS
ncbi:hypothetical protein ACHAXT_012184 [Thalassiosira profunda]